MKSIKFVLKRGLRKSDRVVNLIKVHYIHVWNYHSEAFLYNYYILIKKIWAGYTLVIECFPSIHEDLDLILSTVKKKKNPKE
jgi:hypothetical protein